MNKYQVNYEASGHVSDTIHVVAVTNEQARYKAFDEIVDRGFRVLRFLSVLVWDERANRWVKTHEHAAHA